MYYSKFNLSLSEKGFNLFQFYVGRQHISTSDRSCCYRHGNIIYWYYFGTVMWYKIYAEKRKENKF